MMRRQTQRQPDETRRQPDDKETIAEGTKDIEDVVVVEREVSTHHVTAVMSFNAQTSSAKSGSTQVQLQINKSS
jgi:hypothetical protein